MRVFRLTAVAILLFILAAPASARDPEVCGGIGGIPCSAGQFCELEDGECCCDFFGVCTDLPEVCPAVCEPVCGCDGQTYGNRCEAHASAVSVDHAGRCASDQAVVLTGFNSMQRLGWEPSPEAVAYNVYLQDELVFPRSFYGRCLYTAVPESSVLLKGHPMAGLAWMVRVSALFPSGEGPIGVGACESMAPTFPCTCSLPAEVGPCDAAIPRWYHDHQTGQCELFVWGGCGGNANRFETQAKCEAECMNPCDQPAVHGVCQAAFQRWYYNELTGHCDTFTWGGCEGNGNNFQSAEVCRSACGDVCLLPPDPGDCDGICPRWYFDPTSGQCETFVWGCCGGNRNNFATQAACEQECAGFPP